MTNWLPPRAHNLVAQLVLHTHTRACESAALEHLYLASRKDATAQLHPTPCAWDETTITPQPSANPCQTLIRRLTAVKVHTHTHTHARLCVKECPGFSVQPHASHKHAALGPCVQVRPAHLPSNKPWYESNTANNSWSHNIHHLPNQPSHNTPLWQTQQLAAATASAAHTWLSHADNPRLTIPGAVAMAMTITSLERYKDCMVPTSTAGKAAWWAITCHPKYDCCDGTVNKDTSNAL